jgi:hypothetical protein
MFDEYLNVSGRPFKAQDLRPEVVPIGEQHPDKYAQRLCRCARMPCKHNRIQRETAGAPFENSGQAEPLRAHDRVESIFDEYPHMIKHRS